MKEETYQVRLKLSDSLDEAMQLAEQSPNNYSVGLHGWLLVTLPHKLPPPKGLMERWIAESFRLLAPKALQGHAIHAPSAIAASKKAQKKSPKKKVP